LTEWRYDANGNRLTQTGTDEWTLNVRSTNNQITSTTGTQARTYTYDAAGNSLTYQTNTFTYSDSDRMKTVKVGSSTTTYVINALGQRIKKSGGSAGTVLYMYDEAGHTLGEYTSTGALTEETIWLGDTPVATIVPSGSTVAIYYVISDHLNTPKKISQPSSNKLAWRWDNDPFGIFAPNQNPQSLGTFVYNLRYPGQMYDSEAALTYNYARDYDPQTGRYVESDPLGLSAGMGTYTYVGDNPEMRFDVLGLDDKIKPEQACKLVEKGYKPDDDSCGCQKDVVNNLCSCWTKYSWFYQIGQLAVCTEKAYLTKSKCVQDCSSTACNRTSAGRGSS
jgi:RHS repeat-associated protein